MVSRASAVRRGEYSTLKNGIDICGATHFQPFGMHKRPGLGHIAFTFQLTSQSDNQTPTGLCSCRIVAVMPILFG